MSEGSKGLNFCYIAVDFTGSQRILYVINLKRKKSKQQKTKISLFFTCGINRTSL